ncbi:MAG: LuxR C-terminal-related transcriptional regulator [Actinomycetota bacterium]
MNEHLALSPRQREVLSLLCEGRSARAISVQLGLSEATVRNHIREVLVRTGSHSQLEAVAKARREHLVELG